MTRSRPSGITAPKTRQRRSKAFDVYFERKFRKSPLVMGLGLISSAFVSGFGAHAIVNSPHADDVAPSQWHSLEQCMHSLRDVIDQWQLQCHCQDRARDRPRDRHDTS